jgi:hypothetical protein
MTEIIEIAGKLIIGCSFVLIGLYVLCKFVWFYIKSKASLNWANTEGTVIVSEYVSIMNGDGPDIEYRIKYKYEIVNREYVGDRLFFQTFDSDNKNYLKKFPIGRKVKVFYNPTNNKECVLEPGIGENLYVLIPIGLIITTIGILILVLG